MDTGSEKGCSEDRLDDSLESSEAGSDWVEEIPLELEGLMECQSIWNTLGKLYVRFMFLNTDLYRHREN